MTPPNLQSVVEKDLKAAGLDGFSVMSVRPEFEMQYIRLLPISGPLAAAEGQLLCRVYLDLEPDDPSSFGADLGEVWKAFDRLSREKKLLIRDLNSRNREVSVTVDMLYGCPWTRKFLEYFLHVVGPEKPTPPVKHTL